MPHANNNRRSIKATAHGARLAGALIGALTLLSLLLAAPALANLEHVAAFAPRGEYGTAWQGWMHHPISAAVNTTGAGGVPKGTLYAVSSESRISSVARFDPDGEFREAWGWGVAKSEEEGDAQEIKSEEERFASEHGLPGSQPVNREKRPSVEFQRCGPDGEPAHPQCATKQGQDAIAGEGDGIAGEGAGQLETDQAVAVDQSTGYVYVLTSRQHGAIQVYSADGSRLIASFGERGKSEGEHIAESPEKIHGINQGGLAVNASGEVYVYDSATPSFLEPSETRAMVFRPHEGDYADYEYAGRASDIAVPTGASRFSLDDAGNLYVTGFGSSKIEEFSPAHPAAPICSSSKIKGNGITAATVDPLTGEPFYYNAKTRSIYRLSACNSEGVFVQVAEFPAVQLREEISFTTEPVMEALVFDPAVSWSASRPNGILYAFFEQAGSGQASGEIHAEAEIAFPSVVAESASRVAATVATLRAEINPRGYQTSYDFQYLTRGAYEANPSSERFAGAAELPAGGAPLGFGSQPLTVTAGVAGLSPETEYRYRVVAVSHCNPAKEAEVCETFGEPLALRTYPSQTPGLADGRAYELVSPVDKYGGEVFPLRPEQEGQRCKVCKPLAGAAFPKQAAPDGESIVYEGDQPFAPTGGAPNGNEYLARRTPSGWQTTNLTPELRGEAGEYIGYIAFDSGLDSGLLNQKSPVLAPGAPAGYDDLYLQGSADPLGLSPVLRAAPPNRAPGSLVVRFDAGNLDYTHLLFEANDALTGPSVFAPGAVDGGGGKFNLYEAVGGGLRLVNVLPNGTTVPGAALGRFGSSPDYSHAVSDDGSRVFWSGESGRVYVREDGEQTVEVHDPGAFLTASADGSRVLLADGCLYSLEGEACVDLTKGMGGFQGIAGQSEDLSRVYFVDTAVLTGGEENGYGAKAQTGKDNLYAWDEGATSFIATLGGEAGDWAASPSERQAEASTDGRWLVFYSTASLTGYQNDGPACVSDSQSGVGFSAGACSEAFLFDSATGRLVCASCNPSGVAPIGSTPPILAREPKPSWPQPRYLSDSGRLVFDTQDSLVPGDTNEGAEDVYEWEPYGVGSCRSSFASGGCVDLISGGSETDDSQFFAMDESGRNVFFTTRDRLVRSDTDDLYDLYDAREEGGGLASEAGASGRECQGEACQSTPMPPVAFETPGSTTFSGAGNLVSALPAAAVSVVSGTPKPETSVKRAGTGRLAKELRVCRRKHAKRKRLACEQKARKQARTTSKTTAARRASTNKHSGVGR